MTDSKSLAPFNRITGLVVLEVRCSNPNGDPDMESDPRTSEADGRGVISPVSFKRKLRDLVADKESPAWLQWASSKQWKEKQQIWTDTDERRYEILETRGRKREEISRLSADEFKARYWDARVFGNTFLESMKDQGKTDGDLSHFVSTGAVQVGVGLSAARIEIDRGTLTNKAGVEEGKDRGMAPLGFRVARHGVYSIPFFVNPSRANRTGMTKADLGLFRSLLPASYPHTASAIRPFINVLHAWWIEHKCPFGSCPDYLLIDALTPSRKGGGTEPSTSLKDYTIPVKEELPAELRGRIEFIEDVCAAALA